MKRLLRRLANRPGGGPQLAPAVLIVTTLVVTLVHLVRFGELATAAARTGLMVFGVLYVAGLLTPRLDFQDDTGRYDNSIFDDADTGPGRTFC